MPGHNPTDKILDKHLDILYAWKNSIRFRFHEVLALQLQIISAKNQSRH